MKMQLLAIILPCWALLSVFYDFPTASAETCDCSFSQGDNNGHLPVLIGSAAENSAVGTDIIDKSRQVRVIPPTANVVLVASPRPDCPTAARDENTYFHVDQEEKSGSLTINIAKSLKQLVRPHDISACSYQATMQLMCGLRCDTGIQFMVTIYDVNDHAPEFDQPSYLFELPESTPPGLTAFHISATDADRIGPNSEMSIELLHSGDSPFRLVNSATCNRTFMCDSQLELLKEIDFEKGPKIYQLRAIATDRGTPPLSTAVSVTIKILDVDDEDPVFEAYSTNQHYRVRLEEESDPASVHFGPKDIRPSMIHAHDQDFDVDERLLYSVEPNSFFDIDPDNGTLHMKVSIDRESQLPPIVVVGPFMLYATEVFEPVHTAAAMVQIDLIDINDNAPLFVAPRFYNTSIRENNAVNAYSGITVEASDADGYPYNIIVYEIVEGNEAGLFHADGANGRFYVSASLDFEQQREHRLRLRATNREPYDPKFESKLKNLTDSICHIVVVVEDVNDCAPEFPPGDVIFEIPEDMRVGAVVGKIEAHDNDTVGVDTYDLKDTPIGITNIIVDTGRNNNIRHKRQISAEAPASTTSEPHTRSMTTGPGTSEGGNTAYFSIHPLTAELYVSSSLLNSFLGFEAKKFQLDVIADDAVNAKAVKHITVIVYDVNNNAPIFTRSDYGKVNVSELALPGSLVYSRVHATDLDSGKYGQVTYSISPSQQLAALGVVNSADIPFAIDPQSGAILLKFALNYVENVVKSYPLIITARDGGEPNNTKSAEAVVELVIVNEHIHPPVVSNISRFEIEETASRNVRIGRINATNVDGGTLEFGWLPSIETLNSPIALDPLSGELFVADTAGISYAKTPQLKLPAFVRDGNDARSHTVSTLVVIDIIHMNVNPPIFKHATFTQNWLEDTPLTLRVEAHDADLPPWNVITYSLDLDGDNVDDMLQKPASASAFETSRKFPFTLNATSGEIGLKFPLPEDVLVFSRQPTFHFAVLATDNGGLKDRAYALIRLVDSNNHTPVFERAVENGGYRAEVSEAATVGTMILRVKATCSDFNPDLQYEVLSVPSNFPSPMYEARQSQPQNPFMIIPGTDAVITMHELDRETIASYQLMLRVHDEHSVGKNTAVNFGNTTLFVKILDVNDNPPVFEHGLYEFDIEEERRYVNFGKVNATDKDEGKNAEFDFKIVGNAPPIIVKRNMTELKRSRRAVTMTSSSGCADNDPNCDQSAWFNFNTYQITSTSTTTTTVRPTTDVPTSYYDNLPFNDPQPTPLVLPPFDVHPLSGFLSTSGRIDRDVLPQDFFKFQIIAADHGDKPLTGTTTVLVRIIDINDNAPEIAELRRTVQTEEGQVASFTVVATDRDIGENAIIRYALKNSSYALASRNDTQNFTIDEVTGVVKSIGLLWIFGTKDEFHIDVEAYNIVPLVGPAASQSNATQQIKIHVHDINNNPPIFDNQTNGYEVVLTENEAELNKNVLILHATDADLLPENRMLKYSLVTQPNNKNLQQPQHQVFRIDPDSGAIFIVANVTPLLTDILTSFPLVAAVSDGPHTSYANVTINILDSNNHAPECKVVRPHLQLGETAEPETLLRVQPGIVCTDADFGDNALLHYVLEFDAAASKYNKTVMSYGNISAPPQAFRLRSKDLPLIELARHIDFQEGDKLFKFGLRVLDSGEPVLQTMVPLEIEILNENLHPPEFPIPRNSSYNFEVYENAALGTAVGNVTAYDRDGNALTYRLSLASQNSSSANSNFYPQSNTNNPFSMQPSQSGIILVAQKLDAIRPPKDYNLVVSAFDGFHTTEARVFVHVMDVNEFAPEFTQLVYSGEVPEFDGPDDDLNQPDFTSFGKNDRRLFKRDIADEVQNFGVNNQTAVAETQANEQLERIKWSIFNVSATDRDSGLFGQVHYELGSGNYDIQPVEVPHMQLQKIPFQPTMPAALPFTIDGLTGALMIRPDGLARLEYESPMVQDGELSSARYARRATSLRAHNNEFLFYVRAIDGGGLSTQAGVRIRIVDRNNKWPKFERPEYSLQIFEEGPPSCIDVDIGAHDEDTVGQLTYYVTNTTLAQKFRYDRPSHRLCTRVKLDREDIPSYEVDLSVFDEIHTAHAMIHFKVLDINDHAPVFIPHPDLLISDGSDASTIRINIPEDIAQNTNILNMGATDEDEGANAEIDYFLHGAGEADTFDIDAVGNIKVLRSLVGKNGRHALKIMARDRGNPPLNTSANVLVYVNSTNEHAPQFERLLYKAVLRENAPPAQTVVRLDAPDPDGGESGNVFFHITHARPDNDSFVVIKQSKTSGVLRTTRPLDYEKPEERFYELVIEARDNAYAPRTSTALVQILLQDENDNAPTLALMPEQVRYLARNLHVESVLYQFYAFDPDSGANGQTTINLLACSHPQLVALRHNTNSTSRHKHTELVLLAEPRAVSIEIQVNAVDHGTPARQSSSARTMGISIVEQMDSTPMFKPSPLIPPLKLIEDSSSNTDDDDQQMLWVEEESPAGLRLNARVQAVSGDGAPIIYQLMLPDEAIEEARFFSMEPQSGTLFLLSHLHKPTRPVYHLPVVAVNSYSTVFNSQGVIVVHIRRFHDECPYFPLSVYTTDVAENVDKNALVMTLAAVRPDKSTTSNVTFAIEHSSSSPNSLFALRSAENVNSSVEGNSFDTNEEPAYTAAAQHLLQTQVFVQHALDADYTITNNNESMQLAIATANYHAAILRHHQRQRRSATNDDEKNSSRQIGGVSYDAADVVHSITVSVRDMLDRRASAQQLVDGSNAKRPNNLQCVDTALVLIRVLNVNDGVPQFDCERYEGSVLENSVPQTNVCVRGIHCTGLPSRSILAAKKLSRFRRSADDERRLLSGERDNVRPWLSSANDVKKITDTNDLQGRVSTNNMCPSLTLPTCERISAQDPDVGDTETLHYGISSGDDSVGYFYLDSRTGQLLVNRVGLDRETVPAYHLTITATDRAGNTGNATLIVVLEDEDDNAPVFAASTDNVTVQENKFLVNPQRLYKLNATDADIGENARIIYLIVNAGPSAAAGEGDASSRFRVDEQGVVWATAPLDRDALMEASHGAADAGNGRALYPLTILATNPKRSQLVSQSLPSQIFRLNILINDTNDTPPVFQKPEYFVEVPSNSPVPLRVLQLEAKDPDFFQPPLRYRILNTASPFLLLSNDQQSGGTLMLTEKFTHYDDMMNEMPLTIEVDDSLHRAQARVRVHIVRARRTPHFLDAEYHMSVPEMVVNGTRVGKVTAIDPDQQKGSASTLAYSLRSFSDADTSHSEDDSALSSSMSKHFRIDPQTGEIFTKADLLRETASHYLLLAEVSNRRKRSSRSADATDDDDDDFSVATARIFVTILNVNKPPVFNPSVYEFTVDEGYFGAPSLTNFGLFVGKVNVIDKDEGENGRIVRLIATPMSEQDGAIYFNKMSNQIATTTTRAPVRNFTTSASSKTTDYVPIWPTELEPKLLTPASTVSTTQRISSSSPKTSTSTTTTLKAKYHEDDTEFHPKSKYSSFSSVGNEQLTTRHPATSTTPAATTSSTTTTAKTTTTTKATSTTSTKASAVVLVAAVPTKSSAIPQLKESESFETEDFLIDDDQSTKSLASSTAASITKANTPALSATTATNAVHNTALRFSNKETTPTPNTASTSTTTGLSHSTTISSSTTIASKPLSPFAASTTTAKTLTFTTASVPNKRNITDELLHALAAVDHSSQLAPPVAHLDKQKATLIHQASTIRSPSSTTQPSVSSRTTAKFNSPATSTTTGVPHTSSSTTTGPISRSSTAPSSHRFWPTVTQRTTAAPFRTTTINVPRWIPVRRGLHPPLSSSMDWTSAPLAAHSPATTRPPHFVPTTVRPALRHIVSHFAFNSDKALHHSTTTTALEPPATTTTDPPTLKSVFAPSQRIHTQEHRKRKQSGEISLKFESATTASSNDVDMVVGLEPSLNVEQSKVQPIRLSEDEDVASSSVRHQAVAPAATSNIAATSGEYDQYKLFNAHDEHPALHHRSVQFSPSHAHRIAYSPREASNQANNGAEDSAGGFSYSSVRKRRDTSAALYDGASSPTFQLAANPQTSELRMFGNAEYEATNDFWYNEAHHTYYFNVTAVDGGRPPLSSTAFVKITLRDVNDNQPQFIGLPSPADAVTVSEHAQAGQEVMHFVAYDRDSGANGRVLLDISSTMPIANAETSNITMIENPWAPLIRKYFYLHTISVENKPTDVAPTPEMLPAIRSASSHVRGTLRLSRRLLTFLVAAQDFARKHSIDLRPSPMTNHLVLPVYIVAHDMGQPVALSSYAEIRLNVQQAADRPEFERLVTYVSVDDSTAVGNSLYTASLKTPISVLTENRKTTPRFSIVNTKGEKQLFNISETTGIVTLAASLKTMLKTRHILTLQVTTAAAQQAEDAKTDRVCGTSTTASNTNSTLNETSVCNADVDLDAPMTDTAVLIITINKVRQFSQTHFDFKIPENDRALITEPIYDFDTTAELDGQSPVTYKLHGPTAKMFLIESATGRLFLRQPLNYEQHHTHELLIEVSTPDWQQTLSTSIVNDMNDADNKNESWVRDDDELHFNEAKIIIHVLDKNDNPPFFGDEQRRVFGVMRWSPMSTWFGSVQGRDSNTPQFASLRYRIAPPPLQSATDNTLPALLGRANLLLNDSNMPQLQLDERQIAASLVYVNAITGDLFTAVPLHLAGHTLASSKHQEYITVPIQAVNDAGHGLVSQTLPVKLFMLNAANVVRVVCNLPAETTGEMSSGLVSKFNTFLAANKTAPPYVLYLLSVTPHLQSDGAAAVVRAKSDMRLFGVRNSNDAVASGDEALLPTLVDGSALLRDMSSILPRLAPPRGSSEASLFDAVLPVDDSWQQTGNSLTSAVLGSEIANNANASTMRPAEIALLTIAVLLIVISAVGFVAGCYIVSRRSRRNHAASSSSCRRNPTAVTAGAEIAQQHESDDNKLWNSPFKRPISGKLSDPLGDNSKKLHQPVKSVVSYDGDDISPSTSSSSAGKQQTSPATTTASLGKNSKAAAAIAAATAGGAAAARRGSVAIDPSTTATTASSSSPTSSMVGSALSMLNKASGATTSNESVNHIDKRKNSDGVGPKPPPLPPANTASNPQTEQQQQQQQQQPKQSFLDRIFGTGAKNGDLVASYSKRSNSSSCSDIKNSASRNETDNASSSNNNKQTRRAPLLSSSGGAASTDSRLTSSENTKSVTPPLADDRNIAQQNPTTSSFVLAQYDARGGRRETINPMFMTNSSNNSTRSRGSGGGGNNSLPRFQNDTTPQQLTTTFQPQQQQRAPPVISTSLMSTMMRDGKKNSNNNGTTGGGVQAALRYNANRMHDYLYDADHLPAHHQYRGGPSSAGGGGGARRPVFAADDRLHDDNFLLAPPRGSNVPQNFIDDDDEEIGGEVSDRVADDYYDDFSSTTNPINGGAARKQQQQKQLSGVVGGTLTRGLKVSDDPAYQHSSALRGRTQQLLHHHYHNPLDSPPTHRQMDVDEHHHRHHHQQQQQEDDAAEQQQQTSGGNRFGIFRPLTPMLELSVEGSHDSLEAVLENAAAHMYSSGDERTDAQKESNYYFPALITHPPHAAQQQQQAAAHSSNSRAAP